MNPVEITQGKSFKGLSQYLLQDENRESAERVGMVQTLNLADAQGDQAWRLMLATANSANALKEAAGIKKGKAVKNTVYHYSINFNPNDELTPDRRRDFVKRQHNDRAKEIQTRSAELKERSATEWEALKESYAAEKTAIKVQMSPALKERSAEIKTLFKPYWADMFKRHRDEVKAFEAGDRSAIGRIWTAAAVFKERALEGDYLGGFVAAFSKENRRNIVLKKHDRERADMAERLQAQIGQELGKMKRDFDRQFSQARSRFTDRCDELKTKQDVSWSEIRDAWQSYNNDRAAAFAQAKDRQNKLKQQVQRGRGRGRSPT